MNEMLAINDEPSGSYVVLYPAHAAPGQASAGRAYAVEIEETDTGYRAVVPAAPRWSAHARSRDEAKRQLVKAIKADLRQMRADEPLIGRYIAPDPNHPGEENARVTDYGVPVWALISDLNLAGLSPAQVAADYGMPEEAVRATLAYYRQHADTIDLRIAANVPSAV